MGIAELEPRQLAPTVGMTGSGFTNSPAPSSSSSTSTRLHLPIYVNKAAAPAVCIASSQIASGNQISNSRINNFILMQFSLASHAENATVSIRETVPNDFQLAA
jgi:hypothetical protein